MFLRGKAWTAPCSLRSVGKAFSTAGWAFSFIIFMIVGASCFGEGIKLIGLDVVLGKTIGVFPSLLLPIAVIIPMLFGVVSGSGMAATQSLYRLFVAPFVAAGFDPLRTGVMVSIARPLAERCHPFLPLSRSSRQNSLT